MEKAEKPSFSRWEDQRSERLWFSSVSVYSVGTTELPAWGRQSHRSRPVREEQVWSSGQAVPAAAPSKQGQGLDCTIVIGRVITPLCVCVFGLYLRESDVSGLRWKICLGKLFPQSSRGSWTLKSAHVMSHSVSWIVKESLDFPFPGHSRELFPNIWWLLF